MSKRVELTRRVTFSSGHRYWRQDLSPEANRELYGPWASPYNHGHNYALEVTVIGVVDQATGMVVNIKTIDEILDDRIVNVCNGKSLNDEVPFFQAHSSSVENILLFCKGELEEAFPQVCQLTHLKLEETHELFGELKLTPNGPIMTLTRTYEFAAAHRLQANTLTKEENERLFGKCNNPAGHGHNYLVEVTVEGTPHPQTGMLVDLSKLDGVVNAEVVERYDHRHLNEDLPEFKENVPSSENIALEIFARLDGKVPAKLSKVKLYENARSSFTVNASMGE